MLERLVELESQSRQDRGTLGTIEEQLQQCVEESDGLKQRLQRIRCAAQIEQLPEHNLPKKYILKTEL